MKHSITLLLLSISLSVGAQTKDSTQQARYDSVTYLVPLRAFASWLNYNAAPATLDKMKPMDVLTEFYAWIRRGRK